jgi:hypothetical protein
VKSRAVDFPLTPRASAWFRQSGMLLALIVLSAGLHTMKWAGKPL